jgi:hypothetical protein
LDALNRARRDFKHAGILPNPADWYRVTENAGRHIGDWCSIYLGLDFDGLSAYELLTDDHARKSYGEALTAHKEGRYRDALEHLARALVHALRRVPRMGLPEVGIQDSHQALLLTAFGVSPSQFLTLQEFLPRAHLDLRIGAQDPVLVQWETRRWGHPANWTRRNTDFCLSAFLNVALKIQHAPPMPTPAMFEWIYDDVITARGESVDLWHYVYEGKTILTSIPSGRKPVFRLEAGDNFRCRLEPSPHDTTVSLRDFARGRVSVEAAEVLAIKSEALPGGVAYVDRDLVEVSFLPKENDPFASHWLKEDA